MSSLAPFSTSSESAILVWPSVVSLVRKFVVQKQPSPRAPMAAPYATRATRSYTTPWDTISGRRRDLYRIEPSTKEKRLVATGFCPVSKHRIDHRSQRSTLDVSVAVRPSSMSAR